MSASTQDVLLTIEDGGLGLLTPSGSDVHAIIGCCAQGPTNSIMSTSNITDIVTTYLRGPAVQAAAVALQITGQPILFIRVPSATPGVSGTVTHSGAGTSVVSTTGAPYDVYSVLLKFITGGTIGTAGITFQYSLDNGITFSAVQSLGTANTFAIPNTNMVANFAVGTILAGQQESWTTTPPLWTIADVQTALTMLGASANLFRFVHVVGDLSAANAVSLSTSMTTLATNYRFCGLLGQARDFATADVTEAAWMTSIQTDYASFSSLRVSVTAGHYRCPSPIDGVNYRRPLSFQVAARLINNPIFIDAGRVKDGPLINLATSTTDGLIYHDERNTPGLDAARFLTVRSIIGRQGMYVLNPNMMSPNGSDFVWWQYRSIIDSACQTARDVLLNFLSTEVRLTPAGTILEKDAQDIESRLRSAYRDTLIAPGAVSAVSAVCSRVDNVISTKTINVTIRVTPLGYLKTIRADIGFTNPALALALAS